ncbi:hypothetical protein [Aliiroseovarius crassostreae]|uniref:hypothetical protein n=1 Tax=Aliiroseovarius crassostreae TaxID=154981 RepID=UPI003C7B1E1F
MHRKLPANSNPPSHNVAKHVLGRSANELRDLAQLSLEIQWAISSLLDRAHHPDLSAEIHVLQDIDRLQQTLLDLSKLIDGVNTSSAEALKAAPELANTLTLQSLRKRVFGDVSDDADDNQSDEVTWF